MTDEMLYKTVQEIIKRQFNEANEMMDEALNDSDIDSEYHGQVKSICRQMMAIACNQKEERDFLFRQLVKTKCVWTIQI
jgi:hypothetical protein